MILPLDAPETTAPLFAAVRSLLARGRHAEADQIARGRHGRLSADEGRLLLALRAEIALGLGRFAGALDWAVQGLKGLSPSHALCRTFEAARVRALLGLGRFREAGTAIESRRPVSAYELFDVHVFEAQVAFHSGRLEEAARSAEAACASSLARGDRPRFIEALRLRARTARERGDVSSARADLDRAARVANGLRDATLLAGVLSERADLMAHDGAWTEAATNADRAGRLFARARSPHEHVSAGRRTGLLNLAQGEPGAALPCIERAAATARRGYGTTESRAEIDLLLADAQLAGRDPEAALDRATAALGYFRDAQDPGGLARAHVRRSLAALSTANMGLALREARLAGHIEGAGPVAAGLTDLALGRILLRQARSTASAPFARAARNPSLYPPLRIVAEMGSALSSGAAPDSDAVRDGLRAIEAFGDRRILSIVRSDMKEVFGFDIGVATTADGIALSSPKEAAEAETDAEQNAVREFLPGLLGASRAVRDLGDMVRRAARFDVPISIFGETGTGKENVARAVHLLSPRERRKFVAVNAASLSDELFESELFGHVRGAFTGATSDRVGLVEEAKGGTLFIDEVADLTPRAQVRLLRFLQEGRYRRVGESHERQADVRIVVAANQPLQALVDAGRFREDLYYRLNGVGLTVPPLRDRGHDIVRLARHFVARASRGEARLSADAESGLLAHSWPGNVRELEQEMRRTVVLGTTEVLEWHSPAPVLRSRSAESAASSGPDREATANAASLSEALLGFERAFLKRVLARCSERIEAARELGISRQALHQKIVRYGL